MQIAVVNYHAGNTKSVLNALHRVGANPVLTEDPALITTAAGVILPGQGEASHAMQQLRESGLVEALLEEIEEVEQ